MMKFCNTHQHDLGTAIRRKGIWPLVATDRDTATARARKWLAGECLRTDIDPLIIATFEIYAKALMTCGDYLNSTEHAYCPLCEVTRFIRKPSIDRDWLEVCTKMVLDICVDNDLVRRPH